jgi:hypothetical protein
VALEEKFAEAFIDATHTVLGRKLRPFCLWHLFLLQTLNSPYLSAGKVTPFDLKKGVAICSTRFREHELRNPRGLRAWWQCSSTARFEIQSNRFLEYISDHLQRPDFSIITSETTKAQVPRGQPPEVLQVVCDVIDFTKWPERYIWQMPIGAAYWYQAMFLKSKHDTDFLTPEERIFQAQLKAKLDNQSDAERAAAQVHIDAARERKRKDQIKAAAEKAAAKEKARARLQPQIKHQQPPTRRR